MRVLRQLHLDLMKTAVDIAYGLNLGHGHLAEDVVRQLRLVQLLVLLVGCGLKVGFRLAHR